MGGTRADHDKNYNTHVWSHWLKADFMGNWALVTVFCKTKKIRPRFALYYSEAAFDIYITTATASFSSLASIREVVKTCSFGQMRLVHSCHVQSRGWGCYMLVGRCRTTTTEPRRLFGTEAVSCPSSALPFACFEAISEAAAPGSFRRAHVNQSWNAQWCWSPLIRIMEEEQYKVTPK